MKKALSLLIAVVMIVSAIPLGNLSNIETVFSATASAKTEKGSCGEHVNYALDSATGVLTISGTGSMTDYSKIDSPFNQDFSIKKVVIENGVTSIGSGAFYNCLNITDVTIPDTVKRIGEDAFQSCSNITKINIPNSVTEIGEFAFYACAGLNNISLPSSLERIETYTFAYCTALEEITIPSSVKYIGSFAFWDCSSLKSISIPNSVTTVGECAFRSCYSLKDVTISKKISQLPDNMFYECTALTSVKIPEGVTVIGKNAFDSCSVLSAVFIPSTITKISEGAFANTAVKDVYYGGSNIGWTIVEKDGAFDTQYTIQYSSTPSKVKLAAPVVTAGNVASTGKVKLTWNEISGAAKYRVYRSLSLNGTYTLMKTTTSTSYVNTSATAGTKYYYKVRAITAGGTAGLYCDPIAVVCDCERPVIAVSNDAKTGKIIISWNTVSGASSYQVYRADYKESAYKLIRTVKTTSYTDTSATADRKYYYKVVAVSKNSEATSAYSTYKARTCDLPAPVVTGSLSQSGKPTLAWGEVRGAESYKVYRATSKNGTYKLMKTVKDKTTYTNTNFSAGTTYYYKVKAVSSNTDANSAYSSIVSVSTK